MSFLSYPPETPVLPASGDLCSRRSSDARDERGMAFASTRAAALPGKTRWTLGGGGCSHAARGDPTGRSSQEVSVAGFAGRRER